MEFGPLRAFLAVAEEGHVTRAAARLHLSQPAVSGQLGRLEEELGQRLFHRTPKGMELTEAGALFRRYAESALARLDDGREALALLAGLRRGALSIGGGATATTYLLPPLLAPFHAEHPNIRLFVREQGSQAVLVALAAGELDLGVVTLPATGAPGEAAGPARLAFEPWLEDELRLIVPPGHPMGAQPRFRWRDLAEVPLVLFEPGTAVRRVIDRELEAAGITPVIVMELRSIESIKRMVAEGIGAAFVSRYALEGGGEGAGLGCAEGPLTRVLGLAYRADRPPSAAGAAFLETLRAYRR